MADPTNLKETMNETLNQFIEGCLKFDPPRLAEEEYPEDVLVEENIAYIPDEDTKPEDPASLSSSRRILDIYTTMEDKESEEVFLLIHGGAFVYGCKELDKCFGMHLVLKTGLDVANINYRLMPQVGLLQQLEDILDAVLFLSKDRGYKIFHTVGDSAGGYLSLLSAILLNSSKARADFGLSRYDAALEELQICAKSVNLICGHSLDAEDEFVGYYFDPAKTLPRSIYDLSKAIESYGCPPVVQVTSDNDTLLKENLYLNERLTTLSVPTLYYCAETTEDRFMHHVFPIAHPTWPESENALDLICRNIGK